LLVAVEALPRLIDDRRHPMVTPGDGVFEYREVTLRQGEMAANG
jgi:hypothetical protein